MANMDPYYNRKPVPDEFTEAVGESGLTKQEEYLARERKLSSEKGDLRRFWNPKNSGTGSLDPHYARKQVPDSMIHGVGETGLTPQEEHYNREKKMYVGGVDVRRFSTSADGGMAPQNDPYYGRKPVDKPEIADVGDSGMSRAEEFETRENKAALFDLSADPFQQLSGSGHRGSVSAPIIASAAADARRRSSAVAPHAAHAAAAHSGHNKQTTLPPIESEREGFNDGSTSFPGASNNQYEYGTNTGPATTTTTTTTTTTGATHTQPGGLYHDIVSHDPDSVGPTENR